MKAQRRHELQANTLARQLHGLPELLRQHGNKLLMAIVVILLVILIVRYRNTRELQRQETISEAISAAREGIRNLEVLPLIVPPNEYASRRNELASTVKQGIEVVAQEADEDDVIIRSQAHLARGDLAWTLANLPEPPGAATQQVVPTTDELLAEAEQAYRTVLERYPQRIQARAGALFGLAAIAENRRDWDEARKFYTQVTEASDMWPMYKELASARARMLDDLKSPMLVGQLSNKPTDLPPTWEERFRQLSTMPSTAPATQPGAAEPPSTQPAPTTQP